MRDLSRPRDWPARLRDAGSFYCGLKIRTKLVPDAEKRLLEDLQWAGLQWDEGPEVGGPYGPYKQSERTEIYRKHANELIASGAAYSCFCTPQQAGQAQAAFVTSGCYQDCASLPAEQATDRAEVKREPYTVRLKRPENAKKREYRDLVYGKIVPLKKTTTAAGSDEADAEVGADTILMKSDGTPTYHFANVVDDHLMKITHVIRGVEWMASTPLHYDLYEAFGWTPPEFAHVGLLVDENKAKLSKRNSDLALDVQSMREEHGVLPETLVNYLALQGWSNPLKSDIYTLEGLIQQFDLKFTKGNTMVRTEKLWYLQKQHVARLCEEVRKTGKKEPLALVAAQMSWAILARWRDILEDERFPSGLDLLYYCVDILLADSKSYQSPKHYVERNRYLIGYDAGSVPSTPEKYLTTIDTEEVAVDGQAVQELVKDLMRCDFKQAIRGPDDLRQDSGSGQANRLWFDDTAARIQAGVQHQVLKAVVHEAHPSAGEHLKVNDSQIPFTERTLDNEATLRLFRELAGLGTISGSEENMALRRKKGWQTAVTKYLREKLSYGMPGPSIGVVMALLGYKECCRRLSVDETAGKGW